LLFDITFITFLCFESDMFLSDTSASLFHLFCSSVLESQSDVLKIAGVSRFTSKVEHLWYFMGVSCKVVSVGTLPVLPTFERTRLPAGKGRCSRYSSAIYAHCFVLKINFLLSFVLSIENRLMCKSTKNLHLSISFGKVLTFNI
jgi:hypothetical protein